MTHKDHLHIQTMTQTLTRAREQSGLPRSEIAHRAGITYPALLAYERGQRIPSVVMFLRILKACNMAVDIELSLRIYEADGLDRGEELKQALLLAEQFPAKPSKTLDFPRFGSRYETGGTKARW